ncbi:MAG: Quinol monooxygenase YgiN, partial [Prosthecobacter sp.]|nr:Quinol monooxygenase YgiN [Prosthecobacter sp.]
SRHLEQPNVFALSELYTDPDAVDAHYASPHFAEWKKKVDSGIVLKRTAVRGQVMEG